MRKVLATLFVLAPLLAACVKAEEPLIPELKGKWGSPGILKAIDQKRQNAIQKASLKPDLPFRPEDLCRVTHVTFDKSALRVHALGFDVSLFDVTEVKREGARLILTGTADKKDPASAGKLILLVHNGEVRFDDILDNRRRSLKNTRVPDGDRMRDYGANTLGDAMKLYLDVKPCPSA